MNSERKTERHLAQFEVLVLLAIQRLDVSSERCLSGVVQVLEDRTSRWISVANTFASLEGLARKRCLCREERDLVKPGPGRKSKTLYHLTPFGRDELNLALRDIFSMAESLELWSMTGSDSLVAFAESFGAAAKSARAIAVASTVFRHQSSG